MTNGGAHVPEVFTKGKLEAEAPRISLLTSLAPFLLAYHSGVLSWNLIVPCYSLNAPKRRVEVCARKTRVCENAVIHQYTARTRSADLPFANTSNA